MEQPLTTARVGERRTMTPLSRQTRGEAAAKTLLKSMMLLSASPVRSVVVAFQDGVAELFSLVDSISVGGGQNGLGRPPVESAPRRYARTNPTLNRGRKRSCEQTRLSALRSCPAFASPLLEISISIELSERAALYHLSNIVSPHSHDILTCQLYDRQRYSMNHQVQQLILI